VEDSKRQLRGRFEYIKPIRFKAVENTKLSWVISDKLMNTKSYFQGFTAGLQIPLFGGTNAAKSQTSGW
jgi:hypothetical protein